MQALDKDIRKDLEKTVLRARDEAEKGARAALKRLAVGEAEPYPHLTSEERALRNKLRARGRQLGDPLDQQKRTQETTHLEREVAYEVWHRLLFTRFLAENNLLIYPDVEPPVSVSLQDCEEIAVEEHMGIDGFELAARYAMRMLPQIFRTDDPVLEVDFAPEDRAVLKKLVQDLPAEVFYADDSLGWVYQFWQAKRKDEVNRSGVKIGADELPAVTQLFTEEYMVRFLLENTLGAWWMARHPAEPLPVEMDYLRTLDDGKPAAGTFDGWPARAAEITVMDPCMGSGHFLVAALHLLAPMRAVEEGLSTREAVDAVLRDNLFGLELDPRCTQIAAFALALAAWTFPDAGGYRVLPPLQLACSGLAPEGKLADWLKLAGDDERMQNGMRRLYDLFQKAPTLGTLISPVDARQDAFIAAFHEIRPTLTEVLRGESNWTDADATERSVQAQGIAKAAELLSRKYYLVATNVPYLGMRSQKPVLREFIRMHFPRGKYDLATAFVERCLQLCKAGGTTAAVTPQSWLLQTSYTEFRRWILVEISFDIIARLGSGSFDTISGAVVNVVLFAATNRRPTLKHVFASLDVSEEEGVIEKANRLALAIPAIRSQAKQLKNPDARIAPDIDIDAPLLAESAIAQQGIKTGDDDKWRRSFWEISALGARWRFLQSTVSCTELYGGRGSIIDWGTEGEGMIRPRTQNNTFGKYGIGVSQMQHLPVTIFSGELYDSNVGPIVPKDPLYLPALWAYCSSKEYHDAVRRIDKKVGVTNATLLKVPFEHKRWQKVAERMFPDGMPSPHSNDPTQWVFHGHPAYTSEPLQVAIARLVGYKWPAELDARMELSDEARALVEQAQALNVFADEDGIVCIPPVAGERAASDRLRDLLMAAYGDAWKGSTLRDLVVEAGYKSGDVEKWLRDRFMDQHNAVFQNRPFVWQIWDGHKEGFSALVNYHRLDYKNLEKLAFTYLGTWIRDQQASMKEGDAGAEERLYAAQELQKKLQRILQGEPPYDIFVRWKPIEEQPIGWHPDLNDGVRVNIRPFVQAGVLRKDPRVHWKKDRGKNPPDAPWGEIRRNDLHLPNAEKRKAREKAGVPS